MFKLDEAALNEQFGRMIDTISSHIVSRSADFPIMGQLVLLRMPGLKLMRLLGHEGAEMGVKIIFTRKLLERGTEDALKLVVRQLVDAMGRGLIEKRDSVSYSLTVGPLVFEYAESAITDGARLILGTEVTAVALVEWGWLR